MSRIDPGRSMLLLIDLQERLLPALADPAGMLLNCRRLAAAATLLDVPVVATEQNPARLGGTDPELASARPVLLPKMTFSATEADGFEAARAGRGHVVVVGCEAHVCVLQTALALTDIGARVFVVEDAIGSRRERSREVALRRMLQNGVEVVTTEMVIFEWLVTAAHPGFRDAVALIK